MNEVNLNLITMSVTAHTLLWAWAFVAPVVALAIGVALGHRAGSDASKPRLAVSSSAHAHKTAQAETEAYRSYRVERETRDARERAAQVRPTAVPVSHIVMPLLLVLAVIGG